MALIVISYKGHLAYFTYMLYRAQERVIWSP